MKILNKKIISVFCFLIASFFNSHLFSKSVFIESFFKKVNIIKTCWIKRKLDNFFTVDEGNLYRSRQLGKKALHNYIKRYEIKTIVNLRGENKDKKWWQHEKQVAQDSEVCFCDIAMSSSSLPSKENLKKLLEIYDSAPRPILIHCMSGSDRTGEAAAVWALDQQGKTIDEALKQLSIKYGHMKKKKPAKNFFINIWRGRNWAFTQYEPDIYTGYI
jgi:protein tyrosine phosphatase (PTP) superfamily phosphohydrolase (DUF442 family)